MTNPTTKQIELGKSITVTEGRVCKSHKLNVFNDYANEKRKTDMLSGWIVGIELFAIGASVLLVDSEGNCNVVRLYN